MCVSLQDQWLKRFVALEAQLNEEAERNGMQIVDRFLERQAETRDGLDRVVSYELDGLSLAVSTYVEALALDDGAMPVTAERPYPEYRRSGAVGGTTGTRATRSPLRLVKSTAS